jgi:hypothetical protein
VNAKRESDDLFSGLPIFVTVKCSDMRWYILLLLLFPVCLASRGLRPDKSEEKVVYITVNPNSYVYIGPDTIHVSELGSNLRERLWKSYTGTGKMYDRIEVSWRGEITESQRNAATRAIKDGQQRALTEICLHKYKKLYESLSASKKRKLNKEFPVLFQAI